MRQYDPYYQRPIPKKGTPSTQVLGEINATFKREITPSLLSVLTSRGVLAPRTQRGAFMVEQFARLALGDLRPHEKYMSDDELSEFMSLRTQVRGWLTFQGWEG